MAGSAVPVSGPAFIVPLTVILCMCFSFGPNSLLVCMALAVLVVGVVLLWRAGEAPILLFVFTYQWLQASIGLFYGNLRDLEIEQLTFNGGQQSLATFLSLFGLVCLAAGMRLGAGPTDPDVLRLARRQAGMLPQMRWFQIYVAMWVAALVLQSIAILEPGLGQLLNHLASVKWAAYVMFTFATFSRPDCRKGLWLCAFLLDFTASLGGYFSTFKEIFFFTLLAVAAARVRLTFKNAAMGLGFAACMLYFGLVWTAIKTEYRSFVSGGEAAQIVTVDYPTRLTKLIELTSSLEGRHYADAADQFARRLTYVEYFGVVLDNVPRMIPHEDGAIWWDAVTRPFMPRILFPDKAVLDDSAMTNKYTSIGVAGADRGTSISIGYMGDTYIDFGGLGMMPVIFLLGLVLGRLYRWLTYGPATRGTVGMAMACFALMPAAHLETSAAKQAGGLFAAALASWLLVKFAVPYVSPWLSSCAVTVRGAGIRVRDTAGRSGCDRLEQRILGS